RVSGTIQNMLKITPSNLGVGYGMQFNAFPTGQWYELPVGRIYGVFDGNAYGTERLTLQSGATLVDTLTLKYHNVGIGTNTPTAQLHEVIADGATVGHLITANAYQSANLSEWRTSDGTLGA